MAVAMGALASPSLVGLINGGAREKVGTVHDIRRFSSLGLRCGSQKRSGGRSSLGNSKSCPAPLARRKLAMPRRTNMVCSALQTDAIGEESELKQALQTLKELLDLEGGNSKVASDRELVRFLRSRSFDSLAAAKAVASHQKWREEFVPKGYFVEAEVQGELDAKKAYWISQNKKGRPAILSTGRDHFHNKKDFEEFKRFIVYLLDRLIREVPSGEEQFTVIIDLSGIGLKNLDSTSLIAAFDIVQNHYPLCLDKIFMLNSPLIFKGVWKVVQPLLNEDTRNRITFVDKKKLLETLTNEVDLEYLPKEYGGTADLVLLQDAVTSNWPPS